MAIREATCRSSPAAVMRIRCGACTSGTLMSRSAFSLNGPTLSISTVEYLASGSISLTSPTTVTQPATLLTSVSTAQQVPASDVVANVRLKLWVAIAASPLRLSKFRIWLREPLDVCDAPRYGSCQVASGNFRHRFVVNAFTINCADEACRVVQPFADQALEQYLITSGIR